MNFRSMKRRGEAATLTDQEVDELIALDDGALLWWYAMTARMSDAALRKLTNAALEWKIEIAQREREFDRATGHAIP